MFSLDEYTCRGSEGRTIMFSLMSIHVGEVRGGPSCSV